MLTACFVIVLGGSRGYADAIDQNVRELSVNGKSYKVRLAAALALSKSRDPRAVLAVADALDKDEDATVRRVAAIALEKMIDRETPNDALSLSITALEKAAKTDGEMKVRETAQRALRAIGRFKRKREAAVAPTTTPERGSAVFVNVDQALDQSKKAPSDGPERVMKVVKRQVESIGYSTNWPGGLPTNAELSSAKTRGYIVASTVKKVDITRSGRQTQVACTVAIRISPWAGRDGGEKWEANKAASASGSAKAMTGNTDREVQGGVRDCLEAVSEDVTSRQVVPFLKHLIAM
ncbi:hypothetical protein BH11MYX1_BH11MYX1_29810 [soil metagenome]